MSKTILAQVDGFTPLIDGVVSEVGLITAAVFGKAWRYCQMADGVCKAAQERIADELDISRATVNTHLKKLCEAGYLRDNTPNLVGLPHEYADTGKANLSISFTGITTTCQKDLQPPVKNIDTKKEVKKELKKEPKAQPEPIRPDFKNLNPIDYYKIPELHLFIQATSWSPGSFVIEGIYDLIRESPEKLTKENIAAAFKEWTMRGYKSSNVIGYLEWARDGIPPRKAQNSGYNRSNGPQRERAPISEPSTADIEAARLVLAMQAQPSRV